MIPPLLILDTAPVPGQRYHLRSVIGDVAEQTAVYRGQGRFVNEETGEVITFEVEVKEWTK